MRAVYALLPALLASCAGAPAQPEPPAEKAAESGPPVWVYLRSRYDADGDGRIQAAEYTRSPRGFANLDADHDGVVSAADFDPAYDGKPRGPWKSFSEFVYGEGGPEVGDPAPPFRLPSTTGETIDLTTFRGQRPVVLVFGSFT
jgi:hypothetical protein